MALLPISMLLFLLVALELSLTSKKSGEEGHFAFLTSLIQSSGRQILSERVGELLEKKDAKNLRVLLNEAGIMEDTNHNLENLENQERSIADIFSHHYNRILHYLPDDLKEFFKAYKILWDVQNLKLLMSYVLSEKDTRKHVFMAEPFGFLDSTSFESLAKSSTPDDVLEKALGLLPDEFLSKVGFERGCPINELEFSLDLAAFEYLQKRSEEIGTQKVRLVWSALTGVYEIRNLITIARIKYSETPKELDKFLFPSWRQLGKADAERLLRAKDYSAFLRSLRNTTYGEFIPKGKMNPVNLEVLLKKRLQELELRGTKLDTTVQTTILFLTELEARYDNIRRAVSSVFIENHDRE